MRYHVFALVVKPVNGEVTYLMDDLYKEELIEGPDREPSVDHHSGNVTVYLKVKNKDKFLRYINRTWKENADPTRFIKGKPIYLGLRDKSNNPSDEVKKAKAFIKKAKKR